MIFIKNGFLRLAICFIQGKKYLVLLLILFPMLEYGCIKYYFSITQEYKHTYFEAAYYLTSEYPYLIMMLCSILVVFFNNTFIPLLFSEQVIYRYRSHARIWLSQSAYIGVISFLFAIWFSLSGVVISSFYTDTACDWKSKNTLMQLFLSSTGNMDVNIKSLGYIEIFMLTLVCSFLCFFAMSMVHELCKWQFNNSIIGLLVILLINLIDQMGVGIFYSYNNISYAHIASGDLAIRFIVPVLWIVGAVVIGGVFAQRREYINGT